MLAHSLVRPHSVVALLGIALGTAALGGSAVAGADVIDDWPYYGQSVNGAELPGLPDTSTLTDQQSWWLGLGTLSTDDFDYDHIVGADPANPWYSVSETSWVTPYLFQNDNQQVTSLLDASASYPSVGTVAGQSEAFILNVTGVGEVPLVTNDYLDDPKLGFADAFSPFPGVDNLYVSDSGGAEDVLTAFGQSYTLFDVPAADAAGGAASDLGDGFQQLLTEFTTLF